MNVSVVAVGVGLQYVDECIFSEKTACGSLFNGGLVNPTATKVSDFAEISSSFDFSLFSFNTPGLLAPTKEVEEWISMEDTSDKIGSPASLGVSAGISSRSSCTVANSIDCVLPREEDALLFTGSSVIT